MSPSLLVSASPHAPPRRAFSLLETALATLIVGLTVLAIVRLVTAVTSQNSYAQKTTTANMLASNLRELLATLPFNDPVYGTHLGPNTGETTIAQYDDVEDFNGYTACPPIDANRQSITALPNWQQSVTVTHVNPNNFQLTDSLSTDAACVLDRVTIAISYNSNPSDPTGWTQISSIEFLKAKN